MRNMLPSRVLPVPGTLCGLAAVLWWILAAAGPAAALSPGAVGVVPDRVVVTLQEGVDLAVTVGKDGGLSLAPPALNAVARGCGAYNLERLYPGVKGPATAEGPDLSRVWAVDFDGSHDLASVRAAWAALPEVERAEVVEICPLYPLPDDPYLASQQWFLRNTTLDGPSIRAQGGWAESTGDTSVVVAIVDSGVDWHHPDLGGNGPDYARGAIWINWAEYHGTPGVDDDGNGYVDDIRGWDFVTGITDGEPGQDVNTPDNDPSDFEGHGTGCAGCAAAITNNGVGVAGTAWNCKIMAVRVGWLQQGQTTGVVRMDFASQGMVYAAANGAKVVNCSWGSTSYLSSAVTYCVASGCLIVTAAGNANDEVASYLGTHADVIAVAATDETDLKADFSSYGSWVEISAPGVTIVTTYYDHTSGDHVYAIAAGTSFSSPITAGALALIWSAHPGWSATQVSNRLLDSADPLDALNPGYAGKLGSGRVNLLRALGDGMQKVPAEYELLFDAINESSAGDTVLVRGGTSHPALTIPTRPLTLRGGYAADYVGRDPLGNPTILAGTPTKPALSFLAGVIATTEVDGFRCTGGGGTYFTGTPYDGRYGGGVVVNQASPTLRNLDISGNGVGNVSTLGCGGGLFLRDSESLLDHVQVHDNTGIHGAGVFVYGGAPVFSGCTIGPNTSLTGNLSYPPLGGGLHVLDATVVLQDSCQVFGHDGVERGGGIYAAEQLGSTDLTVDHCDIHDNRARAEGGGLYLQDGYLETAFTAWHHNAAAAGATYFQGGGLYLGTAAYKINHCLVHHNAAHVGGGIMQADTDNLEFRFNTIYANDAVMFGGGLLVEGPGASFSSSTVAFNTAGSGGAGILLMGGDGLPRAFDSNLVVFNDGGSSFGNGIHAVAPAGVTIACCDVHGNATLDYGGLPDPTGIDGNISSDPLFCATSPVDEDDFTVHADSPCLSVGCGTGLMGAAGQGCAETPVFLARFAVEVTADGVHLSWRTTPASEAAEFRILAQAGVHTWEVPWNQTAPGVFAATDSDPELAGAATCRYDLYFRTGGNDWILLESREVAAGTPRITRIVSACPNPFNPRVLVTFTTDRPQRVMVAVYDPAGRRVAVLAEGSLAAGTHEAVWDGRDATGRGAASGPYLLQLRGENVRQTRKVLLLR